MFKWLTITIALVSSMIFASSRLQHKKSLILRLVISFLSETVLCFCLLSFDNNLFAVSLVFGQICSLIYDMIRKDGKFVLPSFCLYICSDALLLPLCFYFDDIWNYAIYGAVLLFCVAIAPVREKFRLFSPTEFLPERKKLYFMMSIFPCIVLIPEVILLIAFRIDNIVSLILISAVFIVLFVMVLWLQREMTGRLAAEELNAAMSRWQHDARDYMNTIRSQRHDFNLHLHAISGLISGGEYEKCSEYVKKLVSEANAVNDIMPVNDAVVGSMLYNMREEARRRGSDINYCITYDMEDIFCNGFECNKIIGNLLQNAIDALQTPEDKAYGIKLSIFKRRGNTVIISENRFTGDPDRIARVFEPGYSTKKGHDGIGLSMILRTAERYGGRVYPEFDKDIIRFVVNIPNKVKFQEGDGEK